MAPKIFSGLKVVELAGVLAGPSAGMFFAELGAEVLKVENKNTGGDMTRQWKTSAEEEDAPVSAYYASVNFYKKVLMANLKDTEDHQLVMRALKEADIAIVNYKPGSAERLGMDYKSLKKVNPRLIYASVEGMGAGDQRPAFDVVLQAETGFISMTGNEGEPYSKMPVALIDLLAAHQLKQGILLALLQREKTGRGGVVSVSLLEAGLASLANQATNWLMAGHLPGRMGTCHPNIAPYGDSFTTADGSPFVLAIGTEKQWKALCNLLSLPMEFRSMDNPSRVENRSSVVNACSNSFRLKKASDLFASFQANGIPYGEILDLARALDRPAARNMYISEQQEGVLKKGLRSVAFKFEQGMGSEDG